MGQFAIKFARLSGLRVVAVTSEKTASLASELGAEVITRDNKSNEQIVDEIRSHAVDSIMKAIDLVGTKTAAYCFQTFPSISQSVTNGKKCLFTPLAMISPKTETPENVEVVTVKMKQFVNDASCRQYVSN